MRPNEKPVSPFLFIHLPTSTYNYISVRFSLGMRFTLQVLAHIQHASSYGVRAPTAHSLADANDYYVLQQRAAVAHVTLSALFILNVFNFCQLLFLPFSIGSETKHQEENKIDHIMRRMICARCESCMRYWMLNIMLSSALCVSHCFALSLVNTHRRATERIKMRERKWKKSHDRTTEKETQTSEKEMS